MEMEIQMEMKEEMLAEIPTWLKTGPETTGGAASKPKDVRRKHEISDDQIEALIK